MEFKDLLNNQEWSMDQISIEEAMRRKVDSGLERLSRQYYRGLLLNSFFLVIFLSFYFIKPSPEMLVSISIICFGFIVLLFKAVNQIRGYKAIQRDQSIKEVLKATLEADERVNKQVQKMASFIYANSVLGGFFLGLSFQGWDFEKMMAKPLAMVIGIVLALIFYFVSQNRSFKSFNRWMNPGYYQARSFIKDQLTSLEEE